MTSKNLFFKLIKQEWKQKIWCPILIAIAFFLGIEVFLLMILQEMTRWPNSYDYSKAHYFANQFMAPDNNMSVTIMTCLTAIVCGLAVFSYVHSRQKLDTYHSLPIKRGKMFWAKYVSGVLFYLIPMMVHVLISLGIAATQDAFSMHGVNHAIGMIVTQLAIYLLVYSMTIVCVMLTGNIIISVLAVGILQCYSLFLWGLKMILFDEFFYTYVQGYDKGIWAFSPIHMIYKLCEKAMDYRADNHGFSYICVETDLVVIVVVAVLVSFVGCLLYSKRATEAAGRSIAFSWTEPLIKTMVVIPFAFYAGCFFDILAPSGFGWYVFGVAFGFLLCCVLMEIIFRLDVKAAFHNWRQIIFNGACVALIVMIFKYDALGYNSYIPAEYELDHCAISLEGLFELYDRDENYNYVSSDEYRMEHMELRGQDMLDLTKKLAADGLHYKEYNHYEGIEDDPEYKATQLKEEGYRSILVGYFLTDGTELYRRYYYDINDTVYRELVGHIFDSVDYKLGSTPVFNSGWNKEMIEVICTGNASDETIIIDKKQQNRLMDTYQAEYMELTFEEVLTQLPIGEMEFVFKGKEERSRVYASDYKIYAKFVNTIALLQEYGFDLEEGFDLNGIESINVVSYDVDKFQEELTVEEQIEVMDPIEVCYTEEEKVQQLLECLVCQDLTDYGEYCSANFAYDVYIILMREDGTREYRYMVFKDEEIPSFVEDDMRMTFYDMVADA